MNEKSRTRLRHYSAAIGSLAVAGPAAAAVEDMQLQTIEGTESSPDFYTYTGSLDLDGDGVDDFGAHGFFSTAGDYGYIGLYGEFAGDPDLAYNAMYTEYNSDLSMSVIAQMSQGDTVDASLNFLSFGHQLFNRNSPSPGYDVFFEQRGFVGVNFNIPGASPHFGCAEIVVEDANGDGAPDLQVVGGVYDDQPETAVDCASRGFVPPEPVTVPVNGLAFWLMAILVGGTMLYTGQRRRRRLQS